MRRKRRAGSRHRGSGGFIDAVTELLEIVSRHRDFLGRYEEQWEVVQ